MLSCTHGLEDDRIYWKECLSLAKEGFSVTHIAVSNEDKNYTSAEGIHLIQVKRTATNPLSRYQFYSKILETAARQKAAVYHFHDWQLNIIAATLKKLTWKPLVIYDAHESTRLLLAQDVTDKQLTGVKKAYYSIKARQADKWEKKKSLICDAIITAEEYVLSTFPEVNGQLRSVIHNYSYFPVQLTSSAVKKEYDVVYAGLLARNRGIIELIEAISYSKKNNTTISLLLLGGFCDITFEKEVQTLIKSEKLEDVITLHPSVPYKEVPAFLEKSKIGICTWHHTHKNKQAIPIKLFEYMACGLPVIFSNDCYASEFVTKSQCGLLVNPTAPAAIAQAILQLLNDGTMYQFYAHNGKEAVKTIYNWEKESLKLINLYNQLLHN